MTRARPALLPFVLVWVALHIVVLAALLGVKALFTKSLALVLLCVLAGTWLIGRIQPFARRLPQPPAA